MSGARIPRLTWPWPVVLIWALAWGLYLAASPFLAAGWAWGLACAVPVALSPLAPRGWRRVVVAAGFPLALAMSGAVNVPGWWWLAPLALLLLVYPLGAWRDAPVFPTPRNALVQLAAHAPLPPGAQVLDAGCGLGDGLQALHRAYPQAQLAGLERSALLTLLCAVRCPWARVRKADIWKASWAPYQLVYLFQRPESMPRAAAKAVADMPFGSWLVSLEFPVPGATPCAHWPLSETRSVWVYRVGAGLDISCYKVQSPHETPSHL